MPAPTRLIKKLCGVELFAELSGEQLDWLIETGDFRELVDGDALFREGNLADAFFVLLGGEIMITKMVAGREQVLARHLGDRLEHQFTGELPLLAGGQYLASATAVGPTQVMVYAQDAFFEMLVRCPQVCRVLLPVLAERINSMERQAGSSRMLQGLGLLAAGLAHELNNPAAASVRAAGELRQIVPELTAAALRWGQTGDEDERALIDRIQARLVQRKPQDPLAAADAADAVADWLYARGVDEAAESGSVLAEHGVDLTVLDELAAGLRPVALSPAVEYLIRALRAGALAEDATEAGRRVVELVERTSSYTNLNRAPERDVDLHEGLEATLTLMGPRLRGIRVSREYGALPDLRVFPSELNQVWTNLIDNAVDAMGGAGELTISTRREGDHAVVEFLDDGPGIPADVLPNVFQPFFTTKDVGKGTGLGLHISMDIVAQRHGGTMEVTSKPGETHFVVRLPLVQPAR